MAYQNEYEHLYRLLSHMSIGATYLA